MRSSRVTEDEICSAIRAGDCAALEEVEAVVLETDGSFSIIRTGAKKNSAFADINMNGRRE